MDSGSIRQKVRHNLYWCTLGGDENSTATHPWTAELKTAETFGIAGCCVVWKISVKIEMLKMIHPTSTSKIDWKKNRWLK